MGWCILERIYMERILYKNELIVINNITNLAYKQQRESDKFKNNNPIKYL